MKPGSSAKKIKINIVTKYYKPSNAVDAVAVARLVNIIYSVHKNVEIRVVTSGLQYNKEINYSNVLEEQGVNLKITRIWFPRVRFGGDKIRFLLGIIEGFVLTVVSLLYQCDAVITLSNPALINLWSNWFLRGKWYYWSFDLYPDAFVAEGLLKADSVVYKLLKFIAYRNPPVALISLGRMQAEYLYQQFASQDMKTYVLPCGIHELKPAQPPPVWATSKKIIIGYVGNIGRAHSLQFLVNTIYAKKSRPDILMLVSVYGYHAAAVIKVIKEINDDNIVLIPAVHQSELSYIDVHMVSLDDRWTNISVPSKAVSAVCAGSVIWFCGRSDADTYIDYYKCSFRSGHEHFQIKSALDQISTQSIKLMKENAVFLRGKILDNECQVVQSLLKNVEQT